MRKYIIGKMSFLERLMFRHEKTKIDDTEYMKRFDVNWDTMNIIAIIMCILILIAIFIAR